jgi:hypothetical protein
MASQRVYVPFTLFNLRAVNLQHVWVPSTEYLGKKTEKPNYFITCVLDRTQMNWWDEPALAPAWAAYSELLAKSGMQPQMISEWPVKDGNMPPEPGKAPSDWAKNRWIIGGSSSNQIKVEMAQPNGSVTPLPQKIGVKPGDYVALGLSAAVKQNNARGIKNYCNTVLFMGAGEEIAVGQSVTGAELMAQAQKQGLTVQGFAPSGGYAPQTFQPQQGGFPGQPQPGFTHGAPQSPGPQGAPSMGAPANPNYGAPAPGGAFVPPGGNATYPSSAPQPGGPVFQPQGAPAGAPPAAGQWQAPPSFAGPGGGAAPGGWTPQQ